jgi:hypothetical protein
MGWIWRNAAHGGARRLHDDNFRGWSNLMLRAFFWVAALVIASSLLAHAELWSLEEWEWLKSWIPRRCCVSSGERGCCFIVQPGTVRSLGDDRWQVIASGEVLPRTDWSPDGKFYRCACDMIDGKWTIHDKAHTRCIFPPRPLS